MGILFVTDLQGCTCQYERVLSRVQSLGVDAVVNGGDVLPKDGNLFEQDLFIKGS